MVKEYYVNPQQRLAIKNRQQKVKNYKVFKQYKKALNEEGVSGSNNHYQAAIAAHGAGADPRQERPTGETSASAPHPRGITKKPKMSAVKAARLEYESKQKAREDEREKARQEAMERQRQQAASKKRRKTETLNAKKRTSRGQPVLTHQLNKMLASLEGR